MHVKSKLNNQVNDHDIIVKLVKDFLGSSYSGDSVNLVISRSLLFFEEFRVYPSDNDLSNICDKLQTEAFEKIL